MTSLAKSLALSLLLISSSSYSYVLRNYFSIINHSKNPTEISYTVCTEKSTNGEKNTLCQDFFSNLDPGESQNFDVDSNDNYFKDKNNWTQRKIYLYQAISQKSIGLFLADYADFRAFYENTINDSSKGEVVFCEPSYQHSVILDDFGSDRIYCMPE